MVQARLTKRSLRGMAHLFLDEPHVRFKGLGPQAGNRDIILCNTKSHGSRRRKRGRCFMIAAIISHELWRHPKGELSQRICVCMYVGGGRRGAHVTRNRRMDRMMLRAGTSPAPVTAIQRHSSIYRRCPSYTRALGW